MGILDMFRRKSAGAVEATGRRGALNASWEVLVGATRSTSADDLWWTLNDRSRLGAYARHPLIFACVRRLCSAYTDATLEIGRFKRGKFHALEKHTVVDLLYKPNPWQDYTAFMSFRMANLHLTGKSFVWKWRNRMGEVAELWPLPTPWVTEIASKNTGEGLLAGYRVKIPGREEPVVVPAGDMIDMRFIDPANPAGAIGPLHAIAKSWQLDEAKGNYMIEMLENLKSPGMVLKFPRDLTPGERDDLRAMLNDTVGRGRRGEPLILGGEGASVEMPVPLSDLDWPGLSAEQESRICMAFGVPPLLVGARVAQENSPLSSPNLEAAEKVFYTGTVSELWIADASVLTRSLVWGDKLGEDLELRYNSSQVPALKMDMQKEAEICGRLVAASIMEINEARERCGLPQIKELTGKFLLPVGMELYDPREGAPVGAEFPERTGQWEDEDGEEDVSGQGGKGDSGDDEQEAGRGTDRA